MHFEKVLKFEVSVVRTEDSLNLKDRNLNF